MIVAGGVRSHLFALRASQEIFACAQRLGLTGLLLEDPGLVA